MHSCRALRACEVTYLVGASAGVIAFDYSPETLRGSGLYWGQWAPSKKLSTFFILCTSIDVTRCCCWCEEASANTIMVWHWRVVCSTTCMSGHA